MILIADSGSYKTDWIILDGSKSIQFSTNGLNPYFIEYPFLEQELNINFPANIKKLKVGRIYFYGTGCSSKEQKIKMKDLLNQYFSNAIIEIETDLLGAARGILKAREGIMVILGTGVNVGYYNNNGITQVKPSLGYILGDEGSGTWLGKQLINSYLHDELPKELKDKFENKYAKNQSGSENEVDIGRRLISELYAHQQPNMYLAQFTDFYINNLKNIYLHNIIEDGFTKLIKLYIKPHYDIYKSPVNFCGSIAYLFKEILTTLMMKMNIELNMIKKSPLEGLKHYYSGL